MFITMVLIIIIEFTVLKALSFKLISTALFIGSLVTGFYTFLINPGVTFKEKNNVNGNSYHCPHCNFTYPKNEKKYLHCFACGICIKHTPPQNTQPLNHSTTQTP